MVSMSSKRAIKGYIKNRWMLLRLTLKSMLIFLLFLTFCNEVALAEENIPTINYDKTSDSLSVEARKHSLTNLLTRITKITGLKISISPEIKKEISIKFSDLSLEEGLKRITRGLSHAMVFSEGEGEGAKPLLISIKIIPKGPSDGSNAVPVEKLADGEMKSKIIVSDGAENKLKKERKVLSVEEKETRKKERNKRRMERIRSKLEKEEEFVESDPGRYAKREKQRARMRQQLDELAEE